MGGQKREKQCSINREMRFLHVVPNVQRRGGQMWFQVPAVEARPAFAPQLPLVESARLVHVTPPGREALTPSSSLTSTDSGNGELWQI